MKTALHHDKSHSLKKYVRDFHETITRPNRQITARSVDNVFYVTQFLMNIYSTTEGQEDFSYIMDEPYNEIWAIVLVNIQLCPFSTSDLYKSLVTNYHNEPFFIKRVSNNDYETIKREVGGILFETYGYSKIDQNAWAYYIVMYHLDYLTASQPELEIAKRDEVKLFNIRTKSMDDDETNVQYVSTFSPFEKSPKTANTVFTLNGVDDKFTGWDTKSTAPLLFSFLEIINTTNGKTTSSYVLSSINSNKTLKITETTYNGDGDNDKTTNSVSIVLGNIKEGEQGFQIDEHTRVTKFYLADTLAILLYDNRGNACSIIFPVGSIHKDRKPISISETNWMNRLSDPTFLLVRMFKHQWEGKITFNDIPYINKDEQKDQRLCWYTSSSSGDFVNVVHMMRLLIEPSTFYTIKGSLIQAFKLTRPEGLQTKPMDTSRFEFLNVISTESLLPVARDTGLLGGNNGQDNLKTLIELQFNVKINLIKAVDLPDASSKQTVCILTDDRRFMFISFITTRGLTFEFDGNKTPYARINDEKITKEVDVLDFEVVFFTKRMGENGSSVFYFQLKLKNRRTDELYYDTHGLYDANITDPSNNQLEDLSNTIEKYKDLSIVHRQVFNRGYYCVYAKPTTNVKPLIFDYIFYKYYREDKIGRLVFFSLSNDNPVQYVVRELRLDAETFFELASVIPVIDEGQQVNILLKFNHGYDDMMMVLTHDNQASTDRTFEFASRKLFT